MCQYLAQGKRETNKTDIFNTYCWEEEEKENFELVDISVQQEFQ